MSFPDAARPGALPSPDDLTVHIIRSTEELQALVPEWIELWCTDPHRTPFQRPEWLLPWWRQFGQPGLRGVTVRSGARLLALLPLYIYQEPAAHIRQLLLLGAGTSDYLDGVYAPECTSAHVLLALRCLGDDRAWDIAELTQLQPHSPLAQALRELGPGRATARAGEHCSRCPALPISQLPSKLRADVRYFLNAAGGRSKVALTVAGEDSLLEIFEVLVELHTERWLHSGEPGVLADPLVLAWHREALPLLARSGLLRLYVLRREAEILAVLYALADPAAEPSPAAGRADAARTAYFYLMGYSAQHARLHPGTLLTALSAEHAAAEGVAVIDMLRGNETYKKFWHTQPVETFGFSVARTSLP